MIACERRRAMTLPLKPILARLFTLTLFVSITAPVSRGAAHDVVCSAGFGSFDATFNNASLIPLPVINNMPVGAPLPPNAGVSVAPIVYTK